jgi:uncharacterized membrane protein
MDIFLYRKQNCPLCDEVKASLIVLQTSYPFTIHVIDVEQNQAFRQYANDVPVVEAGSLILKAPITEHELESAIAQVYRASKKEVLSQQTRSERKNTRIDRLSHWLTRHYLGLINVFLIIFVGLPFLAPVLMKIGLEAPAWVIYKVYRTTCHQLAFRSFFLFGEQGYYPKASAQLNGVLTYDEVTHLGEANQPEDLLEARDFVGSERVGYKIALCQRDVAIYLGILLFNFVFILFHRKIRPLPWYLWLLVGLLPIGLDGLSQLFSQPPLSFIPFRESTPNLRVLTGFLFGFTTAWFGIPNVEAAMKDSLEIIESKTGEASVRN